MVIIAPPWKSGAILDSSCPSVIPSFRHSVILSFREQFVSVQYLENGLKESDQILYAHQH